MANTTGAIFNDKATTSWGLVNRLTQSAGGIFQLDSADFVHGGLQLQPTQEWTPTQGTFVHTGEEPVPEPLRRFLEKRFTSAKTNGNGACSIHALLGRPHNAELYCKHARELISALFAEGFQQPNARAHIETLLGAWWGELASCINQKST